MSSMMTKGQKMKQQLQQLQQQPQWVSMDDSLPHTRAAHFDQESRLPAAGNGPGIFLQLPDQDQSAQVRPDSLLPPPSGSKSSGLLAALLAKHEDFAASADDDPKTAAVHPQSMIMRMSGNSLKTGGGGGGGGGEDHDLRVDYVEGLGIAAAASVGGRVIHDNGTDGGDSIHDLMMSPRGRAAGGGSFFSTLSSELYSISSPQGGSFAVPPPLGTEEGDFGSGWGFGSDDGNGGGGGGAAGIKLHDARGLPGPHLLPPSFIASEASADSARHHHQSRAAAGSHSGQQRPSSHQAVPQPSRRATTAASDGVAAALGGGGVDVVLSFDNPLWVSAPPLLDGD